MGVTDPSEGLDRDGGMMERALALASRGVGLTSPNPMVGAVLVAGGTVVGEGWHEGPGTPHAEVRALAAAGDRARGATLYTTLEPCTHQGRTGPCAPAVAEAGVARVVVGCRDPNPVVDGRGIELLRGNGIEVVEGVLHDRATRLVEGFARHVTTGLPFVTLKMAASLDGRTAARDGTSRWLTGDVAREDVHRLRAASDAIAVGSGTAVADDPALTVRLPGFRGRSPLRVLVDGTGRTPPGARLFDGTAPTLAATTAAAPPTSRRAWQEAGADVEVLDEGTAPGRVPIDRLMEALGKRDVQSVLIEGGPTLAWAALEAGVVDRFVLYLSPKLLGGTGAPGVLEGAGVPTVGEAAAVVIENVELMGGDLRVQARVRTEGAGVHGDR